MLGEYITDDVRNRTNLTICKTGSGFSPTARRAPAVRFAGNSHKLGLFSSSKTDTHALERIIRAMSKKKVKVQPEVQGMETF